MIILYAWRTPVVGYILFDKYSDTGRAVWNNRIIYFSIIYIFISPRYTQLHISNSWIFMKQKNKNAYICEKTGHRRVSNVIRVIMHVSWTHGVYFLSRVLLFIIIFFLLAYVFFIFSPRLTNSTLLRGPVPSFMTLVTDTDPLRVLL